MYTGDGGQSIQMYILRGGIVQLGSKYSLAKLAGVPYLVANQWIKVCIFMKKSLKLMFTNFSKVSFPVENPKTATNFTGFILAYDSQYNSQQSRIWFDDITMVSTIIKTFF